MALRFSRYVDIIILNTEELLPILEESYKIFRDIDFVVRPDVANCKAGADGLINPQQIRNVGPGVGIGRGLVSPSLPQNRSIFLEEAD